MSALRPPLDANCRHRCARSDCQDSRPSRFFPPKVHPVHRPGPASSFKRPHTTLDSRSVPESTISLGFPHPTVSPSLPTWAGEAILERLNFLVPTYHMPFSCLGPNMHDLRNFEICFTPYFAQFAQQTERGFYLKVGLLHH